MLINCSSCDKKHDIDDLATMKSGRCICRNCVAWLNMTFAAKSSYTIGLVETKKPPKFEVVK